MNKSSKTNKEVGASRSTKRKRTVQSKWAGQVKQTLLEMGLKESTAQEYAYRIVRVFERMKKETVHLHIGGKIVLKATLVGSKRLQNQTLKKNDLGEKRRNRKKGRDKY